MWQERTLQQIKELTAKDERVISVEPLGSLTEGQTDEWSDLDVAVIVHPDAFASYFPGVDWLRPLGKIYALNQSSNAHKGTTRLVLSDLRRVDLSISTASIDANDDRSAPDQSGVVSTLQANTNDFRFDAVLAASRAAREDYLIGQHLILGLEQKCLVLAMMLRDQKAGTTHHRIGGPYNEVIEKIGTFSADKTGLISRIMASRDLYSELAAQLDPNWRGEWEPLNKYLAQVIA